MGYVMKEWEGHLLNGIYLLSTEASRLRYLAK